MRSAAEHAPSPFGRWLEGRRSPWILGLLSGWYVLPMWNKYWAPYDEGCFLVNAQRILSGEIPYGDFWSVHAPGQFYLLAGAFKLFGMSLLPGRLLAVVSHGIMCGLLFAIARRLFGGRSALLVWGLSTVSFVGRVGTIPWPTWTAVCFGLLSLRWLVTGVQDARPNRWYLGAGLFTGFAAWFRHDLGLYTWAGGLATFGLAWLAGKGLRGSPRVSLRSPMLYSLGAAIPVSGAIAWLWGQGILGAAFDNSIRFPLTVYTRTRAMGWPPPIWNPLMLFHQGMAFIEANQFYLPLIVYALVGLELLGRWRQGRFARQEGALLGVLCLGIAWLQYVRVRSDVMRLVPVLGPTFVVLPSVLAWGRKRCAGWERLLRRSAVGLLGLLIVPLIVKNVDKYVKNTYKKPFRGQIELVDFGAAGRTYVPTDQAEEVAATVRTIQAYSQPGQRIYVGLTWHGNPQGAPVILYFLAQRLPATRHHETTPGLTDAPAVQGEIMASLDSRTQLVVLYHVMPEGPPTALDQFIQQHFREIAHHGRYRVLKPIAPSPQAGSSLTIVGTHRVAEG